MTSFVRPGRNYVNLGKLYSVPPWTVLLKPKPPRLPPNHVNLGRLYEPTQFPMTRPKGWAYFEDGSVFVAFADYMDHEALETRMRIVEHFVSGPSPTLSEIRKNDPDRRRLIVIGRNKSIVQKDYLRLLARNAQDGETLSPVDQSFENVVLFLDNATSRPISAHFKTARPLNMDLRVDIRQALLNFRGTLVDGILQPNVRLGNGLLLAPEPEMGLPSEQQQGDPGTRQGIQASRPEEGLDPSYGSPMKLLDQRQRPSPSTARQHKLDRREERPDSSYGSPVKLLDRLGVHASNPRPFPSIARQRELDRREAEIAQRERDLIRIQHELLQSSRQQHQPRHSIQSPRNTQEEGLLTFNSAPADSELAVRAAELAAKERELQYREEVLRWKHKTWLLEQKLKEAGDQNPRGHALPRDEAGVVTHIPEERQDPFGDQHPASKFDVESTGDVLPSYEYPSSHAQPRDKTGVVAHNSKERQDPFSDQYPASKSDVENTNDILPFNEFDLDSPAPPQPQQSRRSRIALPTRRTLRRR